MVTQTAQAIESANEIFVRRARKLLVSEPGVGHPAEEKYCASFVKNLESVGYSASKELVDACLNLPLDDLVALNDETLNALRRIKGAHVKFRPMYANFPGQVMEMSDARLYLNALMHYASDGKLLPNSDKNPRPPLNEGTILQPLGLGTRDQFDKIFSRLASSNTSLSEQDKADVVWFVTSYGDEICDLLPETLPNREVRAVVCASLIELTNEAAKRVSSICDTATDVLRLAVAMSGGDESLAEPTLFKSFKRRQRKLLLQLLEGQKNMVEDMLRWKGRWIRLGERLHPGEYKSQFPKSAQAFAQLRNHQKVETFNSKLEKVLEGKEIESVLSILKSRPGDLARRLDHVLRLSTDDGAKVTAIFAGVAVKVSTPVLLQVRQHFIGRTSPQPMRVFMPKGQVAKAQAIANKLPPITSETCHKIVQICEKALGERFAKLAPLGKCYVDPQLKDFLVPFSQRSASKTLRTVSRGSRMSLPQKDTLRFFIWWKNGLHRTDLDLSAVMFDKEFCFLSSITYYNLKDFGGVHSGDIVDAPHGASEFIDISRARCLEQNVRYVAMVVNSYTSQPYCDLPECFAGWMARERAGSGEVYETKTVEDKFDLTANANIAVPAIFDLQEGQVIWADMSLTQWPYWYNTVAANLWGIQLTLQSMTMLNKANLYDLLTMHAKARGQLVDNEKDAKTKFTVASGTPFDLTKIAADFMGM